VEPAVGIEPTTDGLQNRCSAAELSWLPRIFCRTGKIWQGYKVFLGAFDSLAAYEAAEKATT
jgi:hypothetical protein